MGSLSQEQSSPRSADMSQLNSAGILACGAVLGAFGCGLRLPRPALPIPGPDPWGAATALAAIGISRLCPTGCGVVVIDSVVRISPTVRWFVPVGDDTAFVLRPSDLAALRKRGWPVQLGSEARAVSGDTSRVTLSIAAYTFGSEHQAFGAAIHTTGNFRVFETDVWRRKSSWQPVRVRLVFEP